MGVSRRGQALPMGTGTSVEYRAQFDLYSNDLRLKLCPCTVSDPSCGFFY